MKKPLPALLFGKYLSGQCTPDEEALIEEWYASFDNDEDYTSMISDQQKQRLKDTIRQRVATDMGLRNSDDIIPKRHAVIRNIGWVAATGIAASLFIFLGIIKYHHARIKANTAANVAVSFANKSHFITENILSDGSHVWMMPGATLTYHKYFSASKREVNLSGEAFFEVTKNPARPFIIYSRNLITKVWGTSFRVRDSKELAFADVTVLTGKVSVKLVNEDSFPKTSAKNNTSEVMIYPSQQVTYLKKENLFKEKPKADMSAMLIWKKPDISFNNRPLKEVIPVLDKTFNLNISPEDNNINNLLLTADLNGLNFPEIMQMLHKALDVDYDINGQNVMLKTNNNQ